MPSWCLPRPVPLRQAGTDVLVEADLWLGQHCVLD